MKELYLDGQLVDFSGNFALTVESNLFRDINSVTTNRTSTVTLPLSLRNRAFFAQAQEVAMQGAKQRRWMRCEYIVDGIAIIEGGKACLMRVTPTAFEICVFWGAFTVLEAMKSDALKLPDLPTTSAEVVRLVTSPTLSQVGTDFGYSDYYSGYAGDDTTPRLFPTVRAQWVLGKIAAKYGVSINVTDDARRQRLAALLLPLVTQKRYTERADHSGQGFSVTWVFERNVAFEGYFYIAPHGNSVPSLNNVVRGSDPKRKGSAVFFQFLRAMGSVTLHVPTFAGRIVAGGDTTPDITYKGGEWVISMSEGDKIGVERIAAEQDDKVLQGWYESDAPLVVGDNYPIVPNLPEMTCLDFIKEVAAQLGCFVFRHGDGIDLVSVDEIMTAPAQRIAAVGVEEINFRRDGWARANLLTYATDDSQPSNFASEISVDDETIEPTATLFASKFVGLSGSRVPLWEVTTDGDGVTSASLRRLSPRIGIEIGGGTSKVGFTGMSWSDIAEAFYSGYATVAYRPQVVQVSAVLKPWQAKRLSPSLPVFTDLVGKPMLLLSATSGRRELYDIKGVTFTRPYRVFTYAPGMVFHLDGLNRGGVAGQWADTVGGLNWALRGAFTEESDGVVFGANGYAAPIGFTSLPWLGTDATIEAVVRLDKVGGIRVVLRNNIDNGIGFNFGPSYINFIMTGPQPSYRVALDTSAHSFSVSTEGGYKDGAPLTPTVTSLAASSKLRIASDYGSYFLAGKLMELRIYNRHLTAEEVANNYEADKQRYNI